MNCCEDLKICEKEPICLETSSLCPDLTHSCRRGPWRLRSGCAQVAGEGAEPLDASSPPRGEGHLGPRPSLLVLARPRTTGPSAPLSGKEEGARMHWPAWGIGFSLALPFQFCALFEI